MSLTNRFKQRRADFIAALARDHDSGLGELFRLYWLSGMDAADLFFEKFGPGAFWQEHMEAKEKHLGQDADHCARLCRSISRTSQSASG